MRVALIRCSGGLNLGNELINAGGEYLVRQALPEAEHFVFEFYDSCIPQAYKYPSPPFTSSSIDFINGCDLMVFFAGSALSQYCESMLRSLTRMKPRKAMMGVSMYLYDAFERSLCHDLAARFDLICARDKLTYDALGGGANIVRGLDLGLFADEMQSRPREPGGYAVVNIDLIKDNRSAVAESYTSLRDAYGQCYVVENTTTRYTDVEGFVQIGYWETLYNIYANADFVVTNRIHTSVVCVLHGVEFRYTGDDEGGETGRNTLFNELGITLRRDVKNMKSDLQKLQPRIHDRRARFAEEVRMKLATLMEEKTS